MAKKQPDAPSFMLVVTQPFLTYQKGDQIVAPDAIAEALEHYVNHVVRVAL